MRGCSLAVLATSAWVRAAEPNSGGHAVLSGQRTDIYDLTSFRVPSSISRSMCRCSVAGRGPASTRTPSSMLSLMPTLVRLALVRLALVIRAEDRSAITHLAWRRAAAAKNASRASRGHR